MEKLKRDALIDFDKLLMYGTDLQVFGDKALTVVKDLRSSLDELRKEYLEDEDQPEQPPEEELRLEDLKVAVEMVKDCCKDESLIGGHPTYLTMKNLNSYLIGTSSKGLKVLEDATVLFSGNLPQDGRDLEDALYYPPLDCYFLATQGMLFRKDIDDKPAYLFMEVKCGWKSGAFLSYSNFGQRLIVNKDCKNIAVINPSTKEVEIELEDDVAQGIWDFVLFGEQEDKVLFVTRGGDLFVYGLDYAHKTGKVIAKYREYLKDKNEIPFSISVCDKNEYALVEFGWRSLYKNFCTRMIILKITQYALFKTASIDQHAQEIGPTWAIDCFGYAGTHILWVGLAKNTKTLVQVFDYDTETAEFKELKDKRVTHQERNPYKLDRLGDRVYYAGFKGKLMSLGLSN